MGPFEFLEPQSTAEALIMLDEYGSQAKLLAGGTDLVPLMRKKTVDPKYLIDLSNLSDLNYIRSDSKNGLRIGALTTIREIEKSQSLQASYKVLSQAASQLGSIQIRNVATIGGNLCNASPCADMAPVLLILSGKVKLTSNFKEKVVPLEDFFTGPGSTLMKPNEIMTEIQAQPLPMNAFGKYLKYKIGGVGIALVGVGVLLKFDKTGLICRDAKIAFGSVAPIPKRAYEAETKLKGKAINEEVILQAAQIASEEMSPIDDIRASSEYRRELVKVLTRDTINEIIDLAKLSFSDR